MSPSSTLATSTTRPRAPRMISEASSTYLPHLPAPPSVTSHFRIPLINADHLLGSTHPKAVEPSKPRLASARSSKVHRTLNEDKRKVVG